MRAGTHRRAGAPALTPGLLSVLIALLVAGCGAFDGTSPSSSACPTGDVRAPGADAALEALLPRGMIERSPDTVDSGWNCMPATLGSYAAHGIDKLRFAGATWDQGNGDATVVAILAAGSGALDAAWVEEFYTAGAVNAKHTGEVVTKRPVVADAGAVFRLETINELSLQTVVIWPAGTGKVWVVIVATAVNPDASRDEHDLRVETAVSVAATVPVP